MLTPLPQPDAETVAWFWFAYESGVPLRRAKQAIIDRLLPEGLRLTDILAAGPAAWTGVMGLSEEAAAVMESALVGIDDVSQRLAAWAGLGIGLLRLAQPEYPALLRAHLRPIQQPLLLSYRGDIDLLDLPAVLPLAGDGPDAEASRWTCDTLVELGQDGAMGLALARPGLDVEVVRSLLAAGMPFALVLAQGLVTYTPPSGLAAAVNAGTVLLLSPFRPDQALQEGAQSLLPHAASFAQALAHALLLVTPPFPPGLLPEQPCFLRPGLPKTPGCQRYYAGPEELFADLVETPVAAAAANSPDSQPLIEELPAAAPGAQPPPTGPESPPDPEDLINQLSAHGAVPEALLQRIRRHQS